MNKRLSAVDGTRATIVIVLFVCLGIAAAPRASAQTFNDVPTDHWAHSFIEILVGNGITAGCGNNDYCPADVVTRAQMAVFLERGMNGSFFSPPTATGTVFSDIGAGDFAANFIEQLHSDGITAGCGNDNYCPTSPVTRDQMAVFLLRAKYGSSYSPPSVTGIFDDVEFSHWAAPWIEQLATEGITAGCGNGNYCPDNPVTRAQMAVFLVRTFGLTPCRDVSEDGQCDALSDRITVSEVVSYPGAVFEDQLNGSQVQVCAYADAAVPFSLKVQFNPNVVGAFNTPDDILVDLSDDGPSAGDRIANDKQHCATVTLNFSDPVYYPYPAETDGNVALVKFRIRIYDENGVGLSAHDLANNFDIVRLGSIHSMYVVKPSAYVPVSDIRASVQATSHILNIQNAAAAGCTTQRLQIMTNQVYGLFPTTPDPFDQMIMVKAGKSYRHANPQSIFIRDDVDHNSRANFDASASYGSNGRLRAIGCMGNDIDLSAMLHEYIHPYAVYDEFQTGYHFFQSNVDQVGPLSRRGGIEPDGPEYFAQVNVNNSNQRNYLPFSDMTRRAMSLICENEFGAVRYANRLLDGGERIHISETTVVNNDLLEQQYGAMNPTCVESRKDHRALLVVMSDEDGVVNVAYLSALHSFALYHEGDHVGATFNPIAYISGIRTGSFSWATGYRATLQLQLPPFN